MKTSYSQEHFEKLPVVGILRGLSAEHLEPVLQTALEGGLTNIEITMNSQGASDQIRAISRMAGGRMNVGAGTVTKVSLLEDALEAGACFIVTPTLAVPVIQRCVTLGVPVFPGALSPSEILKAWELGATMVKVFPADTLGFDYVRALKACFPKVRLMPTGGVDLQTLADFYRAGADAFGVGSPLFQAARIEAQDWKWLEERCRLFAKAYREVRSQEVDEAYSTTSSRGGTGS